MDGAQEKTSDEFAVDKKARYRPSSRHRKHYVLRLLADKTSHRTRAFLQRAFVRGWEHRPE